MVQARSSLLEKSVARCPHPRPHTLPTLVIVRKGPNFFELQDKTTEIDADVAAAAGAEAEKKGHGGGRSRSCPVWPGPKERQALEASVDSWELGCSNDESLQESG